MAVNFLLIDVTKNNPGTVKVGASSRFKKYAKDTTVKILSIFQCRKVPEKDTHKSGKPFSSTESNKNNHFLKIILSKSVAGKKSHSGKKGALSSHSAFLSRNRS